MRVDIGSSMAKQKIQKHAKEENASFL